METKGTGSGWWEKRSSHYARALHKHRSHFLGRKVIIYSLGKSRIQATLNVLLRVIVANSGNTVLTSKKSRPVLRFPITVVNPVCGMRFGGMKMVQVIDKVCLLMEKDSYKLNVISRTLLLLLLLLDWEIRDQNLSKRLSI
ncbi:hypothetical protein CEXT_114091 [Caerostris extrusa]|uniref:Uncharacterized protein n=1 Tax=Caerostris extrusa TaxID=172846 RepID=A0AAV4RH98_CAEEX|nr:hypothetical protein CEXT_114091 [Caerostris extrusa]